MKTAFLRHMSNQMMDPALAIDKDVMALGSIGENKENDTMQLVDNILRNGNTITQLLNQTLNQSEEDIRKEVEHD